MTDPASEFHLSNFNFGVAIKFVPSNRSRKVEVYVYECGRPSSAWLLGTTKYVKISLMAQLPLRIMGFALGDES